jgi:hypothetical protein
MFTVVRLLAVGSLLLLVAAGVVGCNGSHSDAPAVSAPARQSNLTTFLTHPPLAAGSTCPTTRPAGRHRPPRLARHELGGNGRTMYGQGALWVAIPSVAVAVRLPSGRIYSKVAWFVAAPGQLHIVGRRIDGKPGVLQASVPPGGESAQARIVPTGITLTSLGCWDIAGIVGSHVVEWIYHPRLAHP